MMNLASEVIKLLHGKTLVTAESCTGGMIGAALTGISGASEVYKGGVISYTNAVKQNVLGVSKDTLQQYGAVSAETAREMACGARKLLKADYGVSVTGLAGPGGDTFGNKVGTVFIGFESANVSVVKKHLFSGDREEVRKQAVFAALQLILENA